MMHGQKNIKLHIKLFLFKLIPTSLDLEGHLQGVHPTPPGYIKVLQLTFYDVITQRKDIMEIRSNQFS
jgi:hypothetical protein